ncbi:Uncharacterised protein [uncultured archaeon]|nr:Uncharacterised protein [uncultured archaeon]
MMDFVLLTPAELITQSGVLSAFAVAIAIIALSFMAGEGFSMPSIKAFAKNEAFELMVTAIILLVAVLLITQDGPFDLITKGFMLPGIPPEQACNDWKQVHGPYNETTHTYARGNLAFAQADYFLGCRPNINVTAITSLDAPNMIYLDGVVLRKLSFGYISLMTTEMMVGFFSGLSTGIMIPIPSMPALRLDIGVVPWIGMMQINDIHTLIVDLVGQLWAAFAAQKLLLLFVEDTAIGVFLPFGLMLRAFPFSRKTGSTVIAVVFAAYFVYPTTILINQQIWESIVNPNPADSPNPNWAPSDSCPDQCCTNNMQCLNDSDCCSNDCRFSSSEPGIKRCATPLTDFTQYRSLYSVCYDSKTPEQINSNLQGQAEQYYQGLESVYFQGSASDQRWTKTEGRLEDFWTILQHKADALAPTGEAIALQDPKRVIVSSFAMVEMLVTDVAQFAMIALVFIVLEIVITLTLMKDFAVLIGGEPRILGMTQLV